MRKFILFCLITVIASCSFNHYPVTPRVAQDGTYKIFSDEAQGTAWAVSDHYLVTAGHMCETFSDHFVVTNDVRRFNAKFVMWEHSDTSGHHDLCILEVDGTLPTPLVLARRMPRVGQDIFYVGYPLGKWMKSEGKYLGDVDGEDMDWNDAVFSASCDHGASGSAVMSKWGVWGVLVRLRTDGGFVHNGKDGCAAIPLKDIKALLDDYGVKYTVSP